MTNTESKILSEQSCYLSSWFQLEIMEDVGSFQGQVLSQFQHLLAM